MTEKEQLVQMLFGADIAFTDRTTGHGTQQTPVMEEARMHRVVVSQEPCVPPPLCTHCETRPSAYVLTYQIEGGASHPVFVCQVCMQMLYERVLPEQH